MWHNLTSRDVRVESAYGDKADSMCSERVFRLLTRMRHHASFMMRAVPDTLIELPAISLISARISDRIPMSSP